MHVLVVFGSSPRQLQQLQQLQQLRQLQLAAEAERQWAAGAAGPETVEARSVHGAPHEV